LILLSAVNQRTGLCDKTE